MERTILIINTFTNLIKLEHHRNFLEFCHAASAVPFGLRIKKTPSMMGAPSAEFSESWNGILHQAQASLVALLVINYRDSLEKEHDRAYDLLRTSRSQLTQQEMEHIKEQLAKQHKVLQEKRWKKARKICESNGMSWTLERSEQLRTSKKNMTVF